MASARRAMTARDDLIGLLASPREHERPEVLLGLLVGLVSLRDASERLDAVDAAALAPGHVEGGSVLLEEGEEPLRDGVVSRRERRVAAVGAAASAGGR